MSEKMKAGVKVSVDLLEGLRLVRADAFNWVLESWAPEYVSESGLHAGKLIAGRWSQEGFYGRIIDALERAADLAVARRVESGAVATLAQLVAAHGEVMGKLRAVLGAVEAGR